MKFHVRLWESCLVRYGNMNKRDSVCIKAMFRRFRATTCRGKAYSECVSVALVILRATLVRRICICSLSGFSTLSHKGTILEENISEHKMCVLIFSAILSEKFLILRRIE